MTDPVLTVEDLKITIGGKPVVDGVSFQVAQGEILSVVGESGCGKSMTAFSIMGLLPKAARFAAGRVMLGDVDLRALPESGRRKLRGDEIAMIFQEPVASLNPLMKIGRQIEENLAIHRHIDPGEAKRAAIAMLEEVGIPEPELRYGQYPFELSGGMCQRAMIAMALICRPKLLIADEPTTALDVTIQAQILELMKRLREETGTAILLITHDMGVVADMADRVAVMYAGRVIEEAPVGNIFAGQEHPYTRLLLSTIPRLDGAPKTILPTIEGTVPDIGQWPVGCRFNPRCPLSDSHCVESQPPLTPRADSGNAACWHSDRVGAIL
ncbi:ABC transporter ATP-binding protein [Aquamicrobium sp. LC103]|uniref:ABC transporter ATP-binding protein n=1 Tax=Aquamicrobium sp. LC103 TaxID=1120658 RepID=UPI00063E701F|nr:ABC transporter ATP-binding protein [Aquamicrobium sp. LC103]TKT75883.1 ABC transporter ATP-binding protein [Aquamicrobium sp. LC103]